MRKSTHLALLIVFFFTSFTSIAQSAYEGWDSKYQLVNLSELINMEEEYEKRVESDTTEVQYYLGMNSYRFLAKFNGKFRKASEETLLSMERVLRVKTGNPAVVRQLIKNEAEFRVGTRSIWMPIQETLVSNLKGEVESGNEVLLYTLLCTEHSTEGELRLSFLISEFAASWK